MIGLGELGGFDLRGEYVLTHCPARSGSCRQTSYARLTGRRPAGSAAVPGDSGRLMGWPSVLQGCAAGPSKSVRTSAAPVRCRALAGSPVHAGATAAARVVTAASTPKLEPDRPP